jgi:hypothetical protein
VPRLRALEIFPLKKIQKTKKYSKIKKPERSKKQKKKKAEKNFLALYYNYIYLPL